jgi:hypothetical protein
MDTKKNSEKLTYNSNMNMSIESIATTYASTCHGKIKQIKQRFLATP